MPFVKLDCGILDSTLWIDRAARELFITALLMAEPIEVRVEKPQLGVSSLQETGFVVPIGWYGFVAAAGPGIVQRSGMDQGVGMAALERLGEPEPESRTPDYEGRRMVRVAGGYIILNFDRYRAKDHAAAERQARYRARQTELIRDAKTSRNASRNASLPHNVTQAEAEAEAEAEHTPKIPTRKNTGASAIQFPEALSAEEGFDQEWQAFVKHRRKLRKPLTERAEELTLKKLSQRPKEAVSALRTVLEKGWQSFEWDWIDSLGNPNPKAATNGKSSAHARTAGDREFDRTGIRETQIPTRLL